MWTLSLGSIDIFHKISAGNYNFHLIGYLIFRCAGARSISSRRRLLTAEHIRMEPSYAPINDTHLTTDWHLHSTHYYNWFRGMPLSLGTLPARRSDETIVKWGRFGPGLLVHVVQNLCSLHARMHCMWRIFLSTGKSAKFGVKPVSP